jgi:hypothetical protein
MSQGNTKAHFEFVNESEDVHRHAEFISASSGKFSCRARDSETSSE